MKHFLTFITLLLCSTSFSQENAVSDYPMDESALLWQITTEDNQDTSYLFGTMHMIQAEYYIFPPKLDTIASNADVIIMELAGMPDPYEMMSYVMLPSDENVFDYFNKKQTDSIIEWVTTNTDYTEESFRSAFGRMKPFVLVQLTALSQFEGETESYEEDFAEIARKNQIETVGLETIGDQMKIFDDFSKKEMAALVMESIREEKEGEEDMTEVMQKTYFSQQIDSLYMLIHVEGGKIAEKENAFLTDRNNNWIPKIIAEIKEKEAFIAVGAGHLGGPDGVIRLLQREGYTLTPIRL